jgi:hypothetical protein
MGFAAEPKWMRWSTNNRYEARYVHYGEFPDCGCIALAAKRAKDFFL